MEKSADNNQKGIKLYYSRSAQTALVVTTDENTGYVVLTRPDGSIYEHTGSIIRTLGMEQFRAKCFDFPGTVEEYMAQRKRELEAEQAGRERAEMAKREDVMRRFGEMTSHGPAELTRENIGILLDYLTQENWGKWNLPPMKVAYSANQYATENGRVFVDIHFDNGLKVTNAPVNHRHNGYKLLRELDF